VPIPADKLAHALTGAALAAVLLVVLGPVVALAYGHAGLPWLGGAVALVVLAAGVGKEALDRRWPGHTSDPWDAVATLVGGWGLLALIFVPYLLLRSP